eukprot:CAMPEP_0178448444 /NCGR_PEP_ID=MMETSP0689_2-20121128/41993_1 /TAXON_ID=160604 /ORGANISM="Amphidinium massartii, Strain CS-259" /LENGTH=208 /DNA_ID=CAMNT_0020073641 /DNA_START=51 /DNA_END=676 /DNA_ORIENTATION=+
MAAGSLDSGAHKEHVPPLSLTSTIDIAEESIHENVFSSNFAGEEDDDDICGLEVQPDDADLELRSGDIEGIEDLVASRGVLSSMWQWAANLPERIANFGRMLIKRRAIKIELDALKAIEMVEASHGRVVFTVPRACFDRLLGFLNTADQQQEIVEVLHQDLSQIWMHFGGPGNAGREGGSTQDATAVLRILVPDAFQQAREQNCGGEH